MDVFKSYSWPGNIRELQNVIEFCINMRNGDVINDVSLLKDRFDIGDNKSNIDFIDFDFISKENIKSIESIEKEEILKALDKYKSFKKDKELAANSLGISRVTLYRKIKKISY